MMTRRFGENLDDWIVRSEEGNDSAQDVAHVLYDESERLFNDSRYNEALSLINVAIENDDGDFNFFTRKAEILERLNRYSEADQSLIKALEIENSDEIRQKRALLLYSWANSLNDKQKALTIISEAIELLPESQYSEKFWYLKGSVLDCLGKSIESRICYMRAEGLSDQIKELEDQIEFLKTTKDTLISIAGWRFYFGIEIFKPGMALDLIREPENPHDSDAVRVEVDGETVGYVANSEYTMIENIKSASDIKDFDLKRAEVIFIYADEYVIAKVIG